MGDNWTQELIDSFIAAADYLSSIIEGDLTDITYNGELIDDIVIQASLTDIDGEGGILGQAGPTVVRPADYLLLVGVMQFDVADAQVYDDIDLFDDIVLHEMMHTLGFGTLWDYNGLVTTEVIDDMGTRRPVDDIVATYYNGEAANAVYDPMDNVLDSEDTFIFVETDGGAGTAGGHWDEEAYQLELMTGYIGYYDEATNTYYNANYLSDWSVASLEDLGYDLDPAASGLETIIL